MTTATARPQEAEEVEPDELLGSALSLEGPRRPASAPTVDATDVEPWPVVEVRVEPRSRPWLCVMGLHGGAGASTVATLLGDDVLDVGTAWPVADGWERPLPSLPVLAVARTHLAGIAAADRLARLWAADRLSRSHLVGLVLIDDAPRLLASQKQAARRLARMTPHGWHIPWTDRWRVEEPSLETSSLRTRQVIKNLRAIARETEGDNK